jgi:hypothetical protein
MPFGLLPKTHSGHGFVFVSVLVKRYEVSKKLALRC